MNQAPVSVYVAIGSNVCPVENVPAALHLLGQHAPLTGLSRFYATGALERPEQQDYVNGVVRLDTRLSAADFKRDILRCIETELGRTRTDDRYAPRTMDLDLLLYGDAIIHESGVEVPDPDILKRPFLIRGLLDIDPELRLPGQSDPLPHPPRLRELHRFSDVLHTWWHSQPAGATR